MKVDFCLPVYNESSILEPNIRKLEAYCFNQGFPFLWQIVIIVNGSSDVFADQARKLAADSGGRIKVVVYPQKGKGGALKRYALESDCDLFVYMDIDLAASVEDIPSLIGPILRDGYDLVIGSRMLPALIRKRSFFREMSSRAYVILSQLILGHHFSDMQCGFKAIRNSSFREIIPLTDDNSWFFDTQLIYFAWKTGLRIKEIPIDWSENRYEQRRSKVHIFRNGPDFLMKLIKLRSRNIRKRATDA